MKTLEETKDTIAVKHGFENFEQVRTCIDVGTITANTMEEIVDEVATEYARQMCDLQIQHCYINSEVKTIIDSVFDDNEGGYFDKYKVVVCEESILNTPNVVTTK